MAKKRKYPLVSTQRQLRRAIKKSQKLLKKNLSKKEQGILNKINRDFSIGKDSAKKNVWGGKYKKTRKKIHRKILKNTFKDKRTIDKKDPDLYIMGGVGGSAKTSALHKKIPERTVVLNADDFKTKLSQYDRSPIRRLPLAHAPYLHEESSHLFERGIVKARREKRDVTLDMTFANYKKGKRIIDKFKRKGYDIHFLGTQKYPHQAIDNVTRRFVKSGRYVPPEVIAVKGNEINKNVMSARKISDTHFIVDTTDKENNIVVSRSKYGMGKNFRDPS